MRVVSMRCLWPILLALGSGCGEDDPRPTDVAEEVTPDTDTAEPDVEDTAEPDAEDTADTDTQVGPTCAPLNLSGLLVANDASGTYTLGGLDQGLGDPAVPDAVVFEFFVDADGTYPLGVGLNENYETCRQCVRVIEDVGGGKPRQYFASSGSLTIQNTGGRSARLTLTDVTFVEVTIRSVDLRSIPVDGGACLKGDALTLETAACTPACGDHVCGDDGCGGVCGEGCSVPQVCALDGQRCEVSENVCQVVDVSGVLANPSAGVYRLSLTPLGLGAVEPGDFLQVEFYANAVGGFALNGGVNRNYRTCEQCVRVVVDGRREFFQRSGLLTVSSLSVPIAEPGVDAFVDLEFKDVFLEEITLDQDFNSSKKAGGTCIELRVEGALRSAEL